MPYLNHRRKRLRLKILYMGPGRSGKTTNLVHLHETFPTTRRGDLIRLDTEQERTLFFDYFPGDLGQLRGLSVSVDFFTVPGQSFYRHTRQALLRGVDGVVFVADSDPRREAANRVALDELQLALREAGEDPDHFPLVFQWNKQDLGGRSSRETLERSLNPRGRPSMMAIASQGVGVWDAQREVLRQVLARLREEAQPRASA
ncbi:MAG: gliding-motility protein MglA [Alphaproteobacteria bacterium]|nr:gliding-motility protein MglA [Alphaproteobacteria bacterium]MCB9792022.1 gliding-motility protein MglA [Alphaproteobacteria bacterium]